MKQNESPQALLWGFFDYKEMGLAMNKWIRLLGLGVLAVLIIMGGLFYVLLGDLPSPQEIPNRLILPSVRITDRNGRLLYDVLDADNGRHTVLPLSQIPLPLQQATIATEDQNFYQNAGVDISGILRAFWINLRGREVLAGGSTLTQQVARNLLLTADERSERTIRRKLRESWLAWQTARQFSKEEILAFYLNQMYYGGMAYGVEAAAQTYFGKPVQELTLAECALLAGLTQAPSQYNPFVNPEAAKERQGIVLGLMLAHGDISETDYDVAIRQPLTYTATPYPVHAPHFVMMVETELDRLFSQEAVYQSGGLVVRTTLDLNWQEQAENIIQQQITRLNFPPNGEASHNAHNAALVALDPHNGEILALVGNPDYFDETTGGAINMAISPRQTGSALKPIIYAAALTPNHPHPLTAATLLPDVRTAFVTHEGESYVPVNYSRTENGPVLLRQALASSLNIPAVLTLDSVGVPQAMEFAQNMGITGLGNANDYDLSFALGGAAISLLDLTTAYAPFANEGYRIQPSLILSVSNSQGEVVYTPEPFQPVRVLDERVAWLISDILSDDQARQLSFGKNSILQIDRTAAAKTGTSNDYHDNWTVGYTPDLVVGVWVGNANHTAMENVSGISGAGPIWHYFMRAVLNGRSDHPFTQPPGMVQVEICVLSGLLPTADCPYRRQEWFLAGTQPTSSDTFFHEVTLDQETGLLADENTPPERRVTQLVLDLPPNMQPWARAEGLTLLDDLLSASDQVRTDPAAPLRLVHPDPNTIYRLSPTLPLSAQRVQMEAVTSANWQEVSLWLDNGRLATFTTPPYQAWWTLVPGRHTAWVEGVSANGETVRSAEVTFLVNDVDE